MCQHSKTSKMMRLKKPITVWKFGHERSSMRMATAYQNHIYVKDEFQTIPIEDIRYSRISETIVEFSTGFHAFTNKRQAMEYKKRNWGTLFEFEIPEGSFVNRGQWDCDKMQNTIVTNQIKMIGRVKTI